jgi:hypothetical protein
VLCYFLINVYNLSCSQDLRTLRRDCVVDVRRSYLDDDDTPKNGNRKKGSGGARRGAGRKPLNVGSFTLFFYLI